SMSVNYLENRLQLQIGQSRLAPNLASGTLTGVGDRREEGRTMTEAEWLACTDPGPMLELLRGKASDRKLRPFASGYCLRIWHLFKHARDRRAVEVAERLADGLATNAERRAAALAAGGITGAPGGAAACAVGVPSFLAAEQASLHTASAAATACEQPRLNNRR